MSYNNSYNYKPYKSCCACKKTTCYCKTSCYETCKKPCQPVCAPCPPPLPPAPVYQCCLRWNVKKLVSNQSGVAANVDTDAINCWGILYFDDKIWVSNNGSSIITTYNSSGVAQSTRIAVDSVNSQPELPSGIVQNTTSDFVVCSGQTCSASTILIATETGGVNGWENTVDAGNTVIAINEEIRYALKGIAIGSSSNIGTTQTSSRYYMYVTDFSGQTVQVHDGEFFELLEIVTADAFVDTSADPVPDDFSPFGIYNIKNYLYVTYAKIDPSNSAEDLPGCGNGYINIFRTNGEFVRRFATQGPLNSPWGIIEAPCIPGLPNGALLISNHGDGAILAYTCDGIFLGRLQDCNGKDIYIDGLWGLARGPNNSIFFSAGPNQEENGLVGVLCPIEIKLPYYPNPCNPCPQPCGPFCYTPVTGFNQNFCRGYDYANNCPIDCNYDPKCGNQGVPLCGYGYTPYQNPYPNPCANPCLGGKGSVIYGKNGLGSNCNNLQ